MSDLLKVGAHSNLCGFGWDFRWGFHSHADFHADSHFRYDSGFGFDFGWDFRFRRRVHGDACVCRGVFWNVNRELDLDRSHHLRHRGVRGERQLGLAHHQGHDRFFGRRETRLIGLIGLEENKVQVLLKEQAVRRELGRRVVWEQRAALAV